MNTYYSNYDESNVYKPVLNSAATLCKLTLNAATTNSKGTTIPTMQTVTTTTDTLVHTVCAWVGESEESLLCGYIWISTSGTLDLQTKAGIVITKNVNSNQIVYTIINYNKYKVFLHITYPTD